MTSVKSTSFQIHFGPKDSPLCLTISRPEDSWYFYDPLCSFTITSDFYFQSSCCYKMVPKLIIMSRIIHALCHLPSSPFVSILKRLLWKEAGSPGARQGTERKNSGSLCIIGLPGHLSHQQSRPDASPHRH